MCSSALRVWCEDNEREAKRRSEGKKHCEKKNVCETSSNKKNIYGKYQARVFYAFSTFAHTQTHLQQQKKIKEKTTSKCVINAHIRCTYTVFRGGARARTRQLLHTAAEEDINWKRIAHCENCVCEKIFYYPFLREFQLASAKGGYAFHFFFLAAFFFFFCLFFCFHVKNTKQHKFYSNFSTAKKCCTTRATCFLQAHHHYADDVSHNSAKSHF